MKISTISRKFIKPSTSTPHALRNFHISFTDEMAPTMNVPLILYYTCDVNKNMAAERSNFKRMVEKSLPQVLDQFYPFTGRYIKEHRLVDCSDQGVEYLEAEADCQLLQLLGPGMKPEQLNGLLPAELYAADEFTNPLLSIRITTFECGSIAIGLCISHRLADASTMSTFVTAWANETLGGEGRKQISPIFNSSLFFPGRNLTKLELGISRTTAGNVDVSGSKIVTRRFVFNGKAMSSIRAKLKDSNSTSRRQPTRVQLVLGIILRAILGVDREKNGQSRASLILQIVNFRDKTVPPLPKHSCGNFCAFAKAQCTAEEINNLELEDCVNLVGNAVRKTVADCARILNSGEDGHMMVIKTFQDVCEILSNNADQLINPILLNSWCRFPFYEADFGWGKPVWVSVADMQAGNFALLIDTRDGHGIEAWVTLDEKDMAIFQEHQDIKTFGIFP